MRYRFRTLMIVVACATIVAAIAGAILRANLPTPISRSAEGNRAISQLSDADQASIDAYIDGMRVSCQLSPDMKRTLLVWLKKAIRDTHPTKRMAPGTIRFESPKGDDWIILEINRDELSVQTPYGTWRGLDRSEFERIVRSRIAKD